MESTLEDPRTCYFSFLSASKLARSGPISDKVVGNLIFETFKSLCNVQIVFKIVFRICSEYVQNVQNVFIFCSDCVQIASLLSRGPSLKVFFSLVRFYAISKTKDANF